MRVKAALNTAISAANGALKAPSGGVKGYGKRIGPAMLRGGGPQKAELVGFTITHDPEHGTTLVASYTGGDTEGDELNTWSPKKFGMLTADNAEATAKDLAKMLRQPNKVHTLWVNILRALSQQTTTMVVSLPPQQGEVPPTVPNAIEGGSVKELGQ